MLYAPPRRELREAPLVFDVRPDSSDQKAIDEVIKGNAYERPSVGFRLEPGDRWIDGGANVGAFTAWAARHGCRVVAYEAEPGNYHQTLHNLELNGITDQQVHHAALVADTDPRCEVILHVCDEPGKQWRNSIMWERKKSSPLPVDAVRIGIVIDAGYDCVKLDIEGAEIPMLVDPDGLPHNRIRKLVFEWSFDVERRMAVFGDVIDRLRSLYDGVALSKNNLPWQSDTYDFFPPQVMVWCWRTNSAEPG